LTTPTGKRRLLIISNGIGEDSVGAEIARRLPAGFEVDAYPTLGSGRYYEGICRVVGPRADLASQGSRIDRGTVARDIATGGLATIPPGLAFMRSSRKGYDRHLVIGDFIGVAGCWLSGIRNITYLDVYKTGYGRPYAAIERWIIKRTCRTVFNRSERLAATLVADGVDARAVGNVMMDTIPTAGYDTTSRRTRQQAVLLLPGSRDLTVVNFALQVEALLRLPEELRPDVFLALAAGVDPEELATAAGLRWHEATESFSGDLRVHAAHGALGDLAAAADLVLSQAGTATIQSLGLGKPVITFVRKGERMKRFLEENRLFGEARLIVDADPALLSEMIARLLSDPAEMVRLGGIGRERIGGPGAIDTIIDSLR
jgi:uncharacterized protein (TIGR03492 family)